MFRPLKVISLLTGFIGVIFSGISGFSLHSTQTLIAQSLSVPGSVIAIPNGAPLVRFQHEGSTYEILGKVQSHPPSYRIDESVTVLVKAETPQEARINSWLELYFFGAIFGIVGVPFCFASVLIFRHEGALRHDNKRTTSGDLEENG